MSAAEENVERREMRGRGGNGFAGLISESLYLCPIGTDKNVERRRVEEVLAEKDNVERKRWREGRRWLGKKK